MAAVSAHRHVQLMCGRAKRTAVYPPAMCKAILEGVLEQKKLDETGVVPVGKINLDRLSAEDQQLMWEASEI